MLPFSYCRHFQLLFRVVWATRVRRHLRVHPAVYELLQTCLPAQMFGLDVMGCHVLPRINPEHPARWRLVMRLVRFRPCQPPVINTAFLLSADIAIERFRPGHIVTSFHEFIPEVFELLLPLLSTKY